MEIPNEILKEKLLSFLKEDIGYGDITTKLIIPNDLKLRGVVITDSDGIIAGITESKVLCKILNINCDPLVNDGDRVSKNDKVIELEGNGRAILSCERTLINILMRMSGIATITNDLVNKVKKINPDLKIACTRKTTPGFRYFEKRAVQIGGGDTHRYRLDDMILIKDNHLACIKNFAEMIKNLKKDLSFSKKVELEVKSREEALKGAQVGVDILMLDNFSPKDASEMIDELNRKNLRDRILLEISGNITPDNILQYAKLDVDIISMGFITHSVKALGMSLDIVKTVY